MCLPGEPRLGGTRRGEAVGGLAGECAVPSAATHRQTGTQSFLSQDISMQSQRMATAKPGGGRSRQGPRTVSASVGRGPSLPEAPPRAHH